MIQLILKIACVLFVVVIGVTLRAMYRIEKREKEEK